MPHNIRRHLTCLLSAGLIVGGLSGCATSRSVVDVPTKPAMTPSSPVAASASNKLVLVKAVSDRRQFEANPKSPEVPSLDPAESHSERVKSRAIGRKRNGFGKALGDILLPEDKSVEALTLQATRQAFVEAGYRVVEGSDAGLANETVEIDIRKFWAWMNPGFWAITISSEIAVDVNLASTSGLQRKQIAVKASDNFQTGMEGNWIEVIAKALDLYVADLKSKLRP